MATQVQNRRGSTAEHSTFTGAVAELTVDTDKDVVVVHDGSTAGGFPMLRQDQANLPTSAPSNGVYLPSSNNVAISTNGSGRLFVDSSGRIGLGTSSPQSLFHIDGDATAFRITRGSATGFIYNTGTSTTSPFRVQSNDGSLDLYTRVAQPITFSTNDAERARIDSSGRLGLGTSSPSFNLDVIGTSRVTGSARFDNGLQLKTATQNYIYFDDALSLTRNGVGDRLTIDSSGRVGIGTTNPGSTLNVVGTTTLYGNGGSAADWGNSGPLARLTYLSSNPIIHSVGASTPLLFGTDLATERMRIDSSGRLLVGTSTARALLFATPKLQVEGTGYTEAHAQIWGNSNDAQGGYLTLGKSRGAGWTVVQNNDVIGSIEFTGADGTDNANAATIRCLVDGTPGANDMPGRLVFSTTADGASSPTERMRVRSDGKVLIGTTTVGYGSQNGFTIEPDSASYITASHPNGAASGSDYLVFGYDGSKIGSITQNGTTGVAYNTSSDYRLKENIAPLIGAIDRLIQIPVHRFNFISEPGKTVDGFLAHEAQAVVPECVTGEKDAVDDDGNPVYQGIDQSKLVPLLTAALQEALAEIESLKARVTALEP